MSKHALSFFLFASDAILVGCTESSIFFFKNKDDRQHILTMLIYEWIASILINFASSLILLYIFFKIFQVVKAKTDTEEADDDELLASPLATSKTTYFTPTNNES
jgi:hypothetical protein